MQDWIKFEELKKKWMKDSSFKKAYEELELEYEISLELIKARNSSGLTQKEIASRMGTTQSVIARLESGKTIPSMKTLARYAQATGKHLHVNLS
jgi:ribosome-binding protein aMBF1 (putative translation factor)